MEKGKAITIRPVANGFIVTEAHDISRDNYMTLGQTKVFESKENLTKFIQEQYPEK